MHQDRNPCVHREDNDTQFVVLYEPHVTIITFKWLYHEGAEDFDERISLLVEGKGHFNFCSDSLQWEEPAKHSQTVSSWTSHHMYFFRQGLWWFLDLCDANRYNIAEETTGIRINVTFDDQAGHPFLKLQGKEWLSLGRGKRHREEACSYQICLYSLSTEKPDVPILNRFPGNYQAAFCLTDHADYDQVDPLKAVFWGDSRGSKSVKSGLSGRGLRITKSIFARSFPGYTGIGILDNREFKGLINRLHDEGHEIVPHGIRSFPGTRKELTRDFYEGFQTFKPRTWIDHVYSYLSLLPHSLASEGLDSQSPYNIWPVLKDEGIDLLWTGIDIHHNPPKGRINIFDLTDSNASSYFIRVLKSLSSVNINEVGYYGLEFIDALVGLDKRYRLSESIRVFLSEKYRFRVIGDIVKIMSEIMASSFLGNAMNDVEKKRLVQIFSIQNSFPGGGNIGTFCTIRLNQLGKGLAPENWPKVFDEKGVVLLHAYLACEHALKDNAWKRNGSICQITPAFDQNLEFISDQVQKRRIWNPTIHEMWEWYKEWQKVRLVPEFNTGKWEILNWPQIG